MIIGFDASRAFIEQPTGTENYSYHLMQALSKLGCQERFRLYLKPEQEIMARDFIKQLKNWEIKVIRLKRLWTQFGLAWEMWRNPPDVLFVSAHVVPFFKNPKIPVVTTVHDVPLEFFSYQKTLIQRIYLNRWIEKLRAGLASKLIAVSSATKRDLIEKLGVEPEKIVVIYEGIEYEKFKVQSSKFKVEEIKKKYQIEGEYFIFVGTIQPRKNLTRLVEAFSRLTNQSPASSYQLLVCGKVGWDYKEILDAPRKFNCQKRVRFVDYVDQGDLPCLYVNSLGLVFPSLHEGFGLPILEAYAAGTLVLTSNVSSMPEVGGKEGIYVNPTDVSDIEKGLKELIEINRNPSVRAAKIKRSREWARRFSWDETAKRTLDVLRSVV